MVLSATFFVCYKTANFDVIQKPFPILLSAVYSHVPYFVNKTLHFDFFSLLLSSKLYNMKAERKKRILQLALWTWTWVATLALATFGPIFLWKENKTLTITAIIVNLINGGLMVLANVKMFRQYDELEQKIHAEAMGLTLGATVVVGLTYSLLDQTNLIQSDAEISVLIFFVGITYLVTLLINRKKYL